MKFSEASKRGFGFKLVMSCKDYENVSINSCPVIKNTYEVNQRIILTMHLLWIAVDLNGIIKFCAFMDLPRSVFQNCYDDEKN